MKAVRHQSQIVIFLLLLAAATARAQDIPADPLIARTPAGMVYVPAGEFIMGTDAGDAVGWHLRQNNDALPRHKVTLPAFYIDKTEITNAQYKRYCDATGYPAPPHWKDGDFLEAEAQLPVTHVNWWEATAYAAWAGKRLPGEAEWEKAARGTDGRQYPWGDNWEVERATVGKDKPQPVGGKPAGASPYGALDMAGNVIEWVDDWYGPYHGATIKYPEYGTRLKVLRGGFFWGPGSESVCSTFYRTVNRPVTRHATIGFRCAKSAQ
jgi:formylglycine-generating enzyme required for sulfatase activity